MENLALSLLQTRERTRIVVRRQRRLHQSYVYTPVSTSVAPDLKRDWSTIRKEQNLLLARQLQDVAIEEKAEGEVEETKEDEYENHLDDANEDGGEEESAETPVTKNMRSET